MSFLDMPGATTADIATKAPLNSPAFTGTPTGITKAHVGLSNVDNTPDLNKPVSNAQQAAINGVSTAEAQIWAGWRTAVKNMATTPVKWLAIGDSITEGTGVTVLTDTWPYKTASKIRTAFPSVNGVAVPGNAKDSRGWSPIAGTSSTLTAPWTVAVNGGNQATNSNFGLRFTKSQQIGVGATITGTVTGTSIDVWYTQGTATTGFTVKVDGTQVGGVIGGASAATTDGFVQRVSLGASGSHTVVITAGSGQSYINGVTVYDGNESSGIVPFNAAVHGSQSVVWNATAGNALWKQNVTTLNPHLVTVLLGANDYSSTTGRAAFVSNLTTLVNTIRDNSTYWPTILLLSCYKENFTYTPTWEQYEYGLERMAADLGCAYYDLRTVMPDIGSAQDTQGWYYDTIHPNATGNNQIATVLSNLLVTKSV